MKYFTLTAALMLFINSTGRAQEKFSLEDFAIALNQITSAPQHTWVNSGYTTVNPQHNTVMGVNEFYSPPFAARNFNLSIELKVDSLLIKDVGSFGKGDVGLLYAGGVWFPHKIVRRGTYHHLKNSKLISLGVRSELLPLFGESGFLLKITIKNRSNSSLNLELLPTLVPGNPTFVPLENWSYGQPKAEALETRQISNSVWGNDKTKISLFLENSVTELKAGASATSYLVVLMTSADDTLPQNADAPQLEQAAIHAWNSRLAKYTINIPTLESDISGLKSYYDRSVLSGLVCIWENNAFKVNPHLATSGMDGGAMCSYLWDIAGYAPNMMSLMLDSTIIAIARQMMNIDLEKYYAFAPGGAGVGVRYSYSPSAFTGLVCSIYKFLGADSGLFYSAKKLILNDEQNSIQSNHLIDYGVQHNLLEMRGAGWEHVVVSPNAERVWCLNQLAELGEYLNQNADEMTAWRKQAEMIKQSIRQELWNDDAGWFMSKYPDGYTDCVYSIQAYDALRSGVCKSAMTDALISHLRDGAFLGDFGVSSISAEDALHYEVLDTDWSGGGAFTGDGPQLALILYEIDKSEIAWNVLQRHFWMGKHLLYYPQEHYVDKPMTPAHKRANVVAGMTGAEAILFGLIGLQPNYNGQLWINPHTVPEGTIKIQGFGYRGNIFDIELAPDKLIVTRNHRAFFKGAPKKMRLL